MDSFLCASSLLRVYREQKKDIKFLGDEKKGWKEPNWTEPKMFVRWILWFHFGFGFWSQITITISASFLWLLSIVPLSPTFNHSIRQRSSGRDGLGSDFGGQPGHWMREELRRSSMKCVEYYCRILIVHWDCVFYSHSYNNNTHILMSLFIIMPLQFSTIASISRLNTNYIWILTHSINIIYYELLYFNEYKFQAQVQMGLERCVCPDKGTSFIRIWKTMPL